MCLASSSEEWHVMGGWQLRPCYQHPHEPGSVSPVTQPHKNPFQKNSLSKFKWLQRSHLKFRKEEKKIQESYPIKLYGRFSTFHLAFNYPVGWAGSSRVLLEQIHSFLSPWLSQIANALSSSKKSFWAKNWARLRLWTSCISHFGVLCEKYLWQFNSAAVASSHSQVPGAQQPLTEGFLIPATWPGLQSRSPNAHSSILLPSFYVCVWMFGVHVCTWVCMGRAASRLPQLLSSLHFLIFVCVCVCLCVHVCEYGNLCHTWKEPV